MQSKTVYREWCCCHPELPPFLRPEWMDAACGEAWDVLLFDDGRGQAAYVHAVSHKCGLSLLLNPQLTPYQGFWLFSGDEVFAADCRRAIARWWQERSFSVLEQRFFPGVPGEEWKTTGFAVEQRRTYCISDLRCPEQVWRGMAPGTRRQIKKGERAGLRLVRHLDSHSFYTLFASDHGRPWYSQAYFDRLQGAVSDSNALLWAACDAQGSVLAAAWVVFDARTAYYLSYAQSAQGRSCGALSWLLWQILQYLAAETTVEVFDFEGSMDERIAYAYRHYGAEPRTYVQVGKNSLLGALALRLKRIKDKIDR